MKRRILFVGAILMIAALLFCGCSSSSESSSGGEYYSQAVYPETEYDTGADYDDNYSYEEEDLKADESSGTSIDLDDASSILEASVERKIIYEGYISAQTKNFDEDYDNIMNSLEEVGGYVQYAYTLTAANPKTGRTKAVMPI